MDANIIKRQKDHSLIMCLLMEKHQEIKFCQKTKIELYISDLDPTTIFRK